MPEVQVFFLALVFLSMSMSSEARYRAYVVGDSRPGEPTLPPVNGFIFLLRYFGLRNAKATHSLILIAQTCTQGRLKDRRVFHAYAYYT